MWNKIGGIINMPRCPRCNSIIDEEDRYCPYCGYLVKIAAYKRYTMNKAHDWLKWLGIVILVIVAIVLVGGVINYLQQSSTYPDIHVVSVNGRSYIAGLDIRARVTATLQNYGSADGYAIVKFYTTCDSTRDESIQSVFVPKGQYVTVEADLDISIFYTCHYGAIVTSQHKA